MFTCIRVIHLFVSISWSATGICSFGPPVLISFPWGKNFGFSKETNYEFDEQIWVLRLKTWFQRHHMCLYMIFFCVHEISEGGGPDCRPSPVFDACAETCSADMKCTRLSKSVNHVHVSVMITLVDAVVGWFCSACGCLFISIAAWLNGADQMSLGGT